MKEQPNKGFTMATSVIPNAPLEKTVNFEIVTTRVQDGTVLYYRVKGSLGDDYFTESSTEGSVTIQDGLASVSRTLKDNFVYKNNSDNVIFVELFLDEQRTIVLAESSKVQIVKENVVTTTTTTLAPVVITTTTTTPPLTTTTTTIAPVRSSIFMTGYLEGTTGYSSVENTREESNSFPYFYSDFADNYEDSWRAGSSFIWATSGYSYEVNVEARLKIHGVTKSELQNISYAIYPLNILVNENGSTGMIGFYDIDNFLYRLNNISLADVSDRGFDITLTTNESDNNIYVDVTSNIGSLINDIIFEENKTFVFVLLVDNVEKFAIPMTLGKSANAYSGSQKTTAFIEFGNWGGLEIFKTPLEIWQANLTDVTITTPPLTTTTTTTSPPITTTQLPVTTTTTTTTAPPSSGKLFLTGVKPGKHAGYAGQPPLLSVMVDDFASTYDEDWTAYCKHPAPYNGALTVHLKMHGLANYNNITFGIYNVSGGNEDLPFKYTEAWLDNSEEISVDPDYEDNSLTKATYSVINNFIKIECLTSIPAPNGFGGEAFIVVFQNRIAKFCFFLKANKSYDDDTYTTMTYSMNAGEYLYPDNQNAVQKLPLSNWQSTL